MKLAKISIPYRAFKKIFTVLAFIIFTSIDALGAAGLFTVLLFLTGTAMGVFILLGYEYLYWRNFEYKIGEDGLKIVSGVITKNDRDIPLKRIQNVDVERNIIQRIVGIAKVDVETAGGSKTEASLKYLTSEDADRMQEKVRELKNRRKTTEQEKKGSKREDFSLSNRDLTILSLASLNQRIVGGVLALISIIAGSAGIRFIEGNLSAAQLGIGTVIATFFVLVFWIANSFSTFIKFFDFKLYFHENALEYERGLINRASGTIPEEKIQDIIIEENFIQRYFNFASLKVETAGYVASGNQDQLDTGKETVIPLAKREQIKKYAEELGGYTQPEFTPVDKKAEKRYFRRYLLAGTTLAALIYAISNFYSIPPTAYIPSAIIILFSRKAAQLKWKNIGYFTEQKRLYTRKGFWNRQTYVIPYFRVQNLMQNQSILQRRWNQSSLLIDTAGSVISYPVIPDMDTEKTEKIRKKVFHRFKNSLKQ